MIRMDSLLLIVAVIVALFFIGSFARILREYERAVIFRLGRSTKAILNPGGQGNGPGLVLLVPLIDKMVKVSLQTVALDVAPQDVISRDNVSLKVSAVIYFRVVDPERAIVAVQDYLYATSQIAQTTLGACSARWSWTICSRRATRSTSSCSGSSTSTPSPGASRWRTSR